MLTPRQYTPPALALAAVASLAVLAACTASRPVEHGGYGVNETQPEIRRVLVQPKFEQYPPYQIIAPEAVAPDLRSHPKANEYRTAIRQGAERGAAFAGHLAVANWPCGKGCEQWAFIDARTGKVILGPQTQGGARFSQDSRLFVAGADKNPRYYVWTGSELKPLEG